MKCTYNKNLYKTILLLIILFLAFSSNATVSIDQKMKEHGLVDIQTIDSSIAVDLKYASTDNFTGKNMYGSLRKSYFRPEIARMIAKAQKILKAVNPNYSLIIYDGARPISAQRYMYRLVRRTPQRRYVAYPGNGGHHNYGVVVDISITYKGKPIDMGTHFDCFTYVAHITNEKLLVAKGKITKSAYHNRLLLRSIMKEVGFNTFRKEWWHFDYYNKHYMRKHFRLLDF